MLLAYLLARAGIPVTLLESQKDFDRDFRGDSLHPWTLELFDELGLADELLELPHFPARFFRLHTPSGTLTTTDYSKVRSRFPYVALMPQAQFLDFLARKAAELPNFTLRLDAKVTGLVLDGDVVAGVRLADGEELRAPLVVGADGRFSRMRRLADLPARSLGAQTDILWFTLPRLPSDPPEADVDLYFGAHHYVGLLGRPAEWQVGYSLPKGGYPELRETGVEPIRAFLREHVGWLADRADRLTDLAQTTLLSVDISRVERWYRPGLLLIGDAAHVISPVGGNGILMALQDAVAAANRLVPGLRRVNVQAENMQGENVQGENVQAGNVRGAHVRESDLRAVQEDRQAAIETVQAQQVRTEQRVAKARESGKPIGPPGFLRWITAVPGVRGRSARANAYGPNPPSLDPAVLLDPVR